MASSQRTLGAVYEDFKPKLELRETPEAHILQIQLPGFTRDQVKIKYVSPTKALSISGEKPEGGNRWSRFGEAIPVPENCDVNRLRGQFDRGVLTITMPKKFSSLFNPREEVTMADPKLQRAEGAIPPKPMTGVEGLKRSGSLLSLEEIDQKASTGPFYEEFQPKSEITENLEAYHLQIHLPGFMKDQINIKYISSSRVMNISGDRPIEGGSKWIRVNQVYPVPENCDAERIQGKFDQGILTLTMPKKFIPQLFAPKDEPKTTLEKFTGPPLDKYATPSLEEASDKRSIASLPSFHQKGRDGLVPKPTRLTLMDEHAAPRTASVEGKRIADVVDIIGKGIQELAASASTSVTSIGDGRLNNEEKHLLAVVIAALGAYVSYRSTSSGKPYNY